MASMVDRGDSYHVIYLGSCMMSQMATGLGVLQKALRELYIKYRQAGGGPAAQERYIIMSNKGMSMTYKESASSQPSEVFYAMPNILFWDAVQFVTVRGQDKRVRGAFEPLDNDHSRNKDNLFSILDKRYHSLQQMTHPPLFTCVLRRTSGVKALDVHAFVCSSDEESLSLVHALNRVQNHYKSDEVHETGVFGYRPFGGHSDTTNSTGSPSVGQVFSSHSGPQRPSSVGSPTGSAERQARSFPAGSPGPHQLPLSPRSESLHKSPSLPSPQQNQSGNHQRTPLHTPSQPRVYQLTQEDFQPPNQREEVFHPRGNIAEGPPRRFSPEGDHVYQYLTHIDNSPTSSLPPAPSGGKTVGIVEAYNSNKPEPLYTGSLGSKNGRSGNSKRNPIYKTASKSLDQADEALGRSQAASSGDRNYRPQPKPRTSVVAKQQQQSQSSAQKLGQGHSRYADDSHRYRENQGPPTPSPRQRQWSPPSDSRQSQCEPHYMEYDKHESSHQGAIRPRVLSQQDIHSVGQDGSHSNISSPGYESPMRSRDSDIFAVRGSPTRNNPEAPPRPVAKVPPHKVTGIKVLPTSPPSKSSEQPRNASDRQYNQERAVPSPSDHAPKHFGAPPRKAKSQYLEEEQFCEYPERKNSGSKHSSNWQFRPNKSQEFEYRTLKKEEKKSGAGTKNMGEKLLLSQKKDAEIASVMQDLHFDHYDTYTMTPELPAGNNFEKSLGYFP